MEFWLRSCFRVIEDTCLTGPDTVIRVQAEERAGSVSGLFMINLAACIVWSGPETGLKWVSLFSNNQVNSGAKTKAADLWGSRGGWTYHLFTPRPAPWAPPAHLTMMDGHFIWGLEMVYLTPISRPVLQLWPYCIVLHGTALNQLEFSSNLL